MKFNLVLNGNILTELVAKPQTFFQMEIFYLLSNSSMLEIYMILTSMQNIRPLRGGDHIVTFIR